ncbi:hypothetical protein RvY_01690 [Ramazzottius varieornatus]|uniref:PLAT domain-containing protein n=1 Tax=Ramazzottius varieornatus TaxID=947166 RepID=A0A1D1UHE1_RAMVA|nr:hypothetical protein RvY_01690 [Ramazzottius varieornatus]
MKMRSTLVDALANVPVNSLGAVQQVAASLSQVVGDPHEIQNETQEASANILLDLADRLATDMRVDAGPQEMEETAGFMIRALTNLFDAIDHRRPKRPAIMYDGGPSPEPEDLGDEAKKAGINCVKSLNSVMKSYGATKIVGEDPTEFVSAEMLVGVQQQKAADVKSRIATGKMKEYLEIPDDMGSNLQGLNVQVQTMLSENNLYAWARSSADVTTPNVELSFADPKTQDAKPLKDLKQPIHVAFPLKQEVQEKGISGGGSISLEQWTLSMPARYYTSMNMTMQKITQVPENKSLVIQLNLRTSHNIKLSVLAAEKQPALESTTEAQAEDYQIGETVEGFEDHGQHEPKELYFVYPAAKRTTGTRTVYVTVVAGELTEYKDSTILKTVDNPPRNAVKNITYNFTAFAVACMYWEQSNEEWSTQGCTVSNRTTSKMIHCDCDHTSVFSAGMLVPPNKLEPIDPAELALMFFQNPLILITCAIIWVLYFVTLIYARRLDRKEEEKRGVHVLLDNDPNDTYFYVLTVSTGARPKAGTSAKVGIVLKGTHDQTEPHILNDVLDMKFFETGGEDSFLLATSDYLGELQTISIWHNGEGSRPSWFVDEVLVRDVQTNEVFFFLPDRWLSADKKDYQLSAEIPVSTHDDLTSTYHRFTTFTTSGIRDGHLWISIFFRPPRSPFTRAQRATCVLSLLLTTMLANIMFYGVPTNDPNQQRSFKGFEFNWNQIMLGIRSALVVLPVNLGVIYLFQNAKARHARGLDDVAEGDIPKPEEPPKQQVSITYLNPAMLNLFKFNRPIRKLFVRPLRIERIDNSPLIKHAEHNLPFWTKLVAWLVGLGTAIVSTILVVWFGLHFGRTKSQEWLASFFSALAMDVLFNQPLKVLLVSFLLAAVLRKPPPREHEGTVVSAFSEFRTGVKDIRNRLGYSPPSSEWVAAVRKMTFLTERMRTWLTDIGWFVLFMFSVFVFTYGNTPLGGSRVRTSLDSMFIGTNVLDSNDKEDGPFSKVKTVEMLWLYLESTFLVSYSPEKTARPQLLDKSVHFMVDEANLCLGPARMRQVRIRRENCSLDWRVVSFNMSCLPEYSTALHDTRSFLASWVLPEIATTKNNNGTNRTQSTTVSPDSEDKQDFVSDKNLDVQLHSNDTNNPWVYRNATELGIGHFMANLETYKGGGYVAVIPQQRTKAKERLAELRNSVWIDDLTRAIFLQMNTYNPSTNVFSIMFLVFEFHQSGLIIPFHRIDTIRLMYTDPMTPLDMAAIVFGICAVIFLCFLTVSLVKDISDTLFQRSWKYFRDPWNWLEVFIVSLGWGTVACYTHSQRNKMAAVKLILKAPQDHFVSFYFAVLTELAFLDMAALFLFVCSVKLLKIFRINRKVNSLFYVMNDARVPLVEYGISLLLAMTPFIIAGHVIFGRSLERHATFGASIVTLVRVMVADIDGLFEDYSGAERVLGPVFFLTAVVITIFLYTNAFVSLIMIVYEKTLEERKENIDRDAELADFVVERLKRLLGIRVEHPVIDFTKFPAAVALREMTAHPKNLDAKPKVVRPDEWTHFLEIAELRRLIQNVAQVIRGSGTTDIDASSLPESSFRTDYASHTNNWFFVHGVPTDDIDGPRSFPVDRITRANGMMEGLDGLREEEVVGMSDYNWDQLTIHQNLLADTRLAVDLAMNPEPPPPSPLSIPLPSLRVKKKKKAESDVRSSKSTPFLAKKSLRN